MPASLRANPKQQKVLRHLMDQQQAIEIGRRIWELRENSEETNGSIADYCNVRERTVAGWVAGEGISYKNCKRVAKLFSVDLDWLWRGRKSGSLMDDLSPSKEVDELLEAVAALDGKLDRVLGQLAALATEVAKVQAAQQSQPASKPQGKPKKATGGGN